MPNTKLLALMTTAMALTPAVVAQVAEAPKVYLEADVLIDDQKNGVMIAEGDVVARYEGRELSADKVIYNLTTKKVRAIGNVRIMDPDGTVRNAEEIEVDEKLSDGVATQFAAQLPEGAVVVARSVTREENGTNRLDNAIYTACPICEEEGSTPTWTLRARRAVQNAETKMITYEGAILEIKGVPVLYLPYFAHPDPTSGRRSGLLMPTPELSSKLGFVYEQPYYWSISPSQDLTITPKLYSNVNSALDLNYRRRFYSGAVRADISLAYDYLFDSNGDRQFLDSQGNIVRDPSTYTGALTPSESEMRGHIFAEGLFDIDEVWKWGFGIESASDDLYIRRYNISDQNTRRGLLDTESQRMLNQLFVTGQTANFYADLAAYSVQGLKLGDDDDQFAKVVPMGFAEQVFDFGSNGVATAQASVAVLDRSEGFDSRRISSSLDWKNSYISPGGLILEPLARIRGDYYDFSFDTNATATPVPDETQTRGTAMAAATLRYPMIRRSGNMSIIVEPIATIAHSESNVDNIDIISEDSVFFQYDLPVLFKADPFTQYDLIEQGSRMAAGVRTTASFDNGIRVRGTLGRRWRSEADPAFSIGTNLDGTQSDYLVGGGFDMGQKLSIDTGFRIDNDGDILSVETTGSIQWWRFDTKATYFRFDEEISFNPLSKVTTEGISLNSKIKLTDSIQLLYLLNRNLTRKLNQSQQVALQWQDDCSFFRIGWQQSEVNDRGVGDSDSITFEFGFKTLGYITNSDFD